MVHFKGIREERKIHIKIKSIRTACIILCTTIIVACSIGVNLVTYTGMKETIKKTNSDYKDAVISGYKEQIKDEVGAMLTVVNMVYEKSQSGEMSEKDAKKEAMEILRNARYGEDGEGYFWIDGSTLQKQMVKRLHQRLLIQKNLSLGAGSLPQEIM